MKLALVLAMLAIAGCEKDDGRLVDRSPPPSPPGPRRLETPPPTTPRDASTVPMPPLDVTRIPGAPLIVLSGDYVWVDGAYVARLDATDLGDTLAHALPPNPPDGRIVIAATEEVLYEKVVVALDAARRAGYPDITFSLARL